MIQGNVADCDKNRGGTGLISCLLRLKDLKSIYLVTDPRWKAVLATDTFDEAYMNSKVQDGTFVPFLNTLQLTNDTPEPTKKDYSGGVSRTIRNGKPMMSLEFDNGPLWHGEAYTYNSFRAYGILFVDSAGTLEGTLSADGLIMKAYRLNDFNVRTYQGETPDDTAKTIVEFQIDDEEAYNTRKYMLTEAQLGFNANTDIDGIKRVIISGTVSAASGASITVTARINEGFGIEALTDENFRVRNITTDAVAVIDEVVAGAEPGKYTISFTSGVAENDVAIIELYDATATPPVAVAVVGDNQFYKGASAEITVGA